MNKLKQIWAEESDRLDELFKDYSNGEKEKYMQAYNEGVRFMVEFGGSFEHTVEEIHHSSWD